MIAREVLTRLGIVCGVWAAAATAAMADEPAPEWWRVGLHGGPAWAPKAVRWTGPDQATNIRGWSAGLAVAREQRWTEHWEWWAGGEITLAQMRDRRFSPTPGLLVEQLEVTESTFLAVAGLRGGAGWLWGYVEGAVGLVEADLEIEYPAGGPPTTNHRDTELAGRLGFGVAFRAGFAKADGAVLGQPRLELRVGFTWLFADRSTITVSGTSLGGFRPDYYALRIGLSWRF